MIVCSIGFDTAVNTFIWALMHEKLLFRSRLAALQSDWVARRDGKDFHYDGYRDDYVLCSDDSDPVSGQWSLTLGFFVAVHSSTVLLKIAQMFIMIQFKFESYITDYILIIGQLLCYSVRLFVVLFWLVCINQEGDDLQVFARRSLSVGGPPPQLDIPLLTQLVKDCPISFKVWGISLNRTEVVSLFVAVVGSAASAILGNLL